MVRAFLPRIISLAPSSAGCLLPEYAAKRLASEGNIGVVNIKGHQGHRLHASTQQSAFWPNPDAVIGLNSLKIRGQTGSVLFGICFERQQRQDSIVHV